MNKLIIGSLAALTLSTSIPSAALAQAENLSATEIIQHTLKNQNKGFVGTRSVTVSRRKKAGKGNKSYPAKAKVKYIDNQNYSIQITEPKDIRGIQFNMNKGVNNAYFPDEKLYLFNGDKGTSSIPEGLILGRITDDLALLKQNYTIKKSADAFHRTDISYVLDITPKNPNTTPRRKYWIDKKTFQVLREERFWGSDESSYSQSSYERFLSKGNVTLPTLTPPKDVRRIDLGGQGKNSFLNYASSASAEAKEKIKILTPSYLPPGFQLKNIQVFSLFGARIQLQNYTDGMNSLLVTVRPQQNFFVTMLAGAFSLNLIQKISTLSFHAPNNYAPRSTEKQVVVAFGDVHPQELKKVSASIPNP